MKKVFIISLAVAILMLSFSLPVAALQNRSGNFSKNYTLTGDGGTDMARIAAAQLGKSAGNLGYSEPWCANFVSDCARLAGQTAAIPEHSYCPTLSQRIRSAGGSVVVGTNTITTPKPGDIIFYGKKDYPALLNNEYHVGIVSSVSGNIIYTIEGNVDGGMVKRSRANSGSFNYHYVLRPNYRSAVHNHNFSIKSSEYVHPHREYMACSCGEANWPNPYTGFAIFNPQCAQCQAVGKPKDVKIETLGKKVTVTWAHTPYTAYYNVYLVAEPWRWADIKYSSGNITGNSYTFTNVAKGDYCGFVVARP
ncbi:MAG: CHAP domain-containing protein, partial [Clostridiales bacterium]